MRQFLLFIFLTLSTVLSAQLNVELLSNLPYAEDNSDGSDIWGYVDEDGSEYAIFGTFNGVSVINVTDPRNPVEVNFIEQQGSIWRDMKSWGDYVYVTSDQPGTSDGLLVIDMTTLPDSVTYRNINPDVENLGTINTCHNLYIDEFGYIYLAGCNLNNGGLLIFDAFTTPGDPIFVSAGAPTYSHDIYVRDSYAYSSEIDEGSFAIYDVIEKDDILFINDQRTPFNFAHNTWLSDDGNTIFTTDEIGNAPIASYDISDMNDIKFLDEFRPQATIGQNVIPHNVHVLNDYLIISYYTDGCIIVDASKPDNLVEVGNWDTFLGAGQGFNGAWGAYPFLPSGNILIGDVNSGLFVLEPDYKRAGHLEGTVTDKSTGLAINNASIEIADIDLFDFSRADGVYKTGSAQEGTFTAEISAFGYQPVTRDITLVSGEVVIEDFELEQLPRVNVTGRVTAQNSTAGLEGVEVKYSIQGMEQSVFTDADGNFSIPQIIAGEYDFVVGAWGYKYTFVENLDFNNGQTEQSVELQLEAGIEDNFALDLGWETELLGVQGGWERADPIGQAPAPNILLAPEDDSDDPGLQAYVTGNANSFNDGFLFGTATLQSPEFDPSGMEDATLSYKTWFWASDFQGNPGAENMIITITNGLDSVNIDTIGMENHIPFEWNQRAEIVLSDVIDVTSNMRIIAQVVQEGFGTAVEAGFDDFKVFAGSPSSISSLEKSVDFKIYPNPTLDLFNIELSKGQENGYIQIFSSD
ncbi:MAG: choice-of-anchor B family protein, partial [Saprospiraceae bacterium]|nr:choice-of-anchor B family protein [Saprospiraceae bacterium]